MQAPAERTVTHFFEMSHYFQSLECEFWLKPLDYASIEWRHQFPLSREAELLMFQFISLTVEPSSLSASLRRDWVINCSTLMWPPKERESLVLRFFVIHSMKNAHALFCFTLCYSFSGLVSWQTNSYFIYPVCFWHTLRQKRRGFLNFQSFYVKVRLSSYVISRCFFLAPEVKKNSSIYRKWSAKANVRKSSAHRNRRGTFK